MAIIKHLALRDEAEARMRRDAVWQLQIIEALQGDERLDDVMTEASHAREPSLLINLSVCFSSLTHQLPEPELQGAIEYIALHHTSQLLGTGALQPITVVCIALRSKLFHAEVVWKSGASKTP